MPPPSYHDARRHRPISPSQHFIRRAVGRPGASVQEVSGPDDVDEVTTALGSFSLSRSNPFSDHYSPNVETRLAMAHLRAHLVHNTDRLRDWLAKSSTVCQGTARNLYEASMVVKEAAMELEAYLCHLEAQDQDIKRARSLVRVAQVVQDGLLSASQDRRRAMLHFLRAKKIVDQVRLAADQLGSCEVYLQESSTAGVQDELMFSEAERDPLFTDSCEEVSLQGSAEEAQGEVETVSSRNGTTWVRETGERFSSLPSRQGFRLSPPRLKVVSVNGFAFGTDFLKDSHTRSHDNGAVLPKQSVGPEGTASSESGHCSSSFRRHEVAVQTEWYNPFSALRNHEDTAESDWKPSVLQRQQITVQPERQHHASLLKDHVGTEESVGYYSASASQHHEGTSQTEQYERDATLQDYKDPVHASDLVRASPLLAQQSHRRCKGTAHSEFGDWSSAPQKHKDAAEPESHGRVSLLQHAQSTVLPERQHHPSVLKDHEGTAQSVGYYSASAPQHHEGTSQTEQHERDATLQDHKDPMHSSDLDRASPLLAQQSHRLCEGTAHSEFGDRSSAPQKHKNAAEPESHGRVSLLQHAQSTLLPEHQHYASVLKDHEGTAQSVGYYSASASQHHEGTSQTEQYERDATLQDGEDPMHSSDLDRASPLLAQQSHRHYEGTTHSELVGRASPLQKHEDAAKLESHGRVSLSQQHDGSVQIQCRYNGSALHHTNAIIQPGFHLDEGTTKPGSHDIISVLQHNKINAKPEYHLVPAVHPHEISAQSNCSSNISSSQHREYTAESEGCDCSSLQEGAAQSECHDSSSSPQKAKSTANSLCSDRSPSLQEDENTPQSKCSDSSSSSEEEESTVHSECYDSSASTQKEKITANSECSDSSSSSEEEESTSHSECYDSSSSPQKEESTTNSECSDNSSSSEEDESTAHSECYDSSASPQKEEITANSECSDSSSSSEEEESTAHSERYDRSSSAQKEESTADSEWSDISSSSEEEESTAHSECYKSVISHQQEENTLPCVYYDSASAPQQEEGTAHYEFYGSVSAPRQQERNSQSEFYEIASLPKQEDNAQPKHYDSDSSLQQLDEPAHFEYCDSALTPQHSSLLPKHSGGAFSSQHYKVATQLEAYNDPLPPEDSVNALDDSFYDNISAETKHGALPVHCEGTGEHERTENTADDAGPYQHSGSNALSQLYKSTAPIISVLEMRCLTTAVKLHCLSVLANLHFLSSAIALYHLGSVSTEFPMNSSTNQDLVQTSDNSPQHCITDEVCALSQISNESLQQNYDTAQSPKHNDLTPSEHCRDPQHGSKVIENNADRAACTRVNATSDTTTPEPSWDTKHEESSERMAVQDFSVYEAPEVHSNRLTTEKPWDIAKPTSLCETTELHPNWSTTEGPSDTVRPTSVCETAAEAHSNWSITEEPSNTVRPTSVCKTIEAYSDWPAAEGLSDIATPMAFVNRSTHEDTLDSEAPHNSLVNALSGSPSGCSTNATSSDGAESKDSTSEASSDSATLDLASSDALTEISLHSAMAGAFSTSSTPEANSREAILDKSSHDATSGGYESYSTESSALKCSSIEVEGFDSSRIPDDEDPSWDSFDEASSWYSTEEPSSWSSSDEDSSSFVTAHSSSESETESSASRQSALRTNLSESTVVPLASAEDGLREQWCMSASSGDRPSDFMWMPGSALDPRRGCICFLLPNSLTAAYQVTTQWKIQSKDAWVELNLVAASGGSGFPILYLSLRICSQEILLWLRNPWTGQFTPTTKCSTSMAEIRDSFYVTLDVDGDQIQVDVNGARLTRRRFKGLEPKDPATRSAAEIWGHGIELVDLEITELS